MEILSHEEERQLRLMVNSRLSMVEVVTSYGVQVESNELGKSTYKAYCPFHEGKSGGRERTPSMVIYIETNSFFCFACGMTGDTIKLISLLKGVPEFIVTRELGGSIGLLRDGKPTFELESNPNYIFGPTKTIEPYLVEMGSMIREYITLFIDKDSFDQELEWIENIGRKLDEYTSRVGYNDLEDIIRLRDKLLDVINNRKAVINEDSNSR